MSFSSVTILSPAKVNLALHITGQDTETGYHYLDSTVCFPHWGDFLTFTPSDHISLMIKGGTDDIPAGDDNLIIKAYHILCEAVQKELPKMNIHLTKNIPSQAGLGGGSSNAATCLLVWKKLFLPDISLKDLIPIALKIGADVPVCLYRTPCLMKGFGEDITPLPQTGVTYHMILAKPQKGANTQNIFTHLTSKNNPPLSNNIPLNMLMQHSLENGRNDLADAAKMNTPDIENIHKIFAKNTAIKYDVTGSGSASFALFSDEKAAYKTLKMLNQDMADIFTLQTKVIL